ncbi:hypothetical protein GCM10023194_80990 [Planotetraspora phitsanulokensis]|uniref:Uncharacterized protein n=1 Tax=Planotetraspora phitsanulokensis TaxID=575192 RepID=A0A8J3UDG4_9ACTN|nr:hypothetical protein [Planotetraspora phitsanulokensis]GII42827.1 hypothetical protein Pph01_78300 [Planotetraspora phitsanulokensis]
MIQLTCAAHVPVLMPVCPSDVVAVRRTACVHEHFQDEPACAEHLVLLEEGKMLCSECRRLGHICELRAVAVVEHPAGEQRVPEI